MLNCFVAHSSPPRDELDKPPHLYSDHIHGVEKLGMEYARRLFGFANLLDKEIIAKLNASLRLALRVHDIGKLEPQNQDVLSGKSSGRLPYDHVDGGVAVALSKQDTLAAWLIRAHHFPGLASVCRERSIERRGLPILRGERYERDDLSRDRIKQHRQLIEKSDELLEELALKHEQSCDHKLAENITNFPKDADALTTRLLLSCLVDSDHSDTAAYYAKNYIKESKPPVCVRWHERLKKLEDYISKLKGRDVKRKKMRDELFDQCRANYSPLDKILTCAAPVGLGKTTSVMANLLNCAKKEGLRRIFVVAPYTNIIKQTVDTLRKGLVLEGENPHAIIAEHHHRANFDSPDSRQYAQLWKAPIVVTTAVQFFETLASASPSSIRKLHELPGSAIFIDECHACVPAKLMKQAWHWIQQLASCWSCHFVLASGSLVKFWEREEIVGEERRVNVPSLLSNDFFRKAQDAEQKRVDFRKLNDGSALTKAQLRKCILSEKMEIGSKLIILNTVQSAAVIAKELQPPEENSNDLNLSDRSILHLSTALTPNDRDRIIEEIKARQSDKNNQWKNRNWYLVATSCVEAGVDLDFNFGYRERCSVTSFLQTAGRVNREGLSYNSIVYDFLLKESDGIVKHPAFNDSIKVFDRYWEKMLQESCDLDDLSTRALAEEIVLDEEKRSRFVSRLMQHEQNCDFQEVQELFKIIESKSVTVLITSSLRDRLNKGASVTHHEIQRNSVQIWSTKIKEYNLEPCCFGRDLYYWGYGYDPDVFGYMKDLNIISQNKGIII